MHPLLRITRPGNVLLSALALLAAGFVAVGPAIVLSEQFVNLEEYRNDTRPDLNDTDDDSMWDGWEVHWALNPLDPPKSASPP